jgi:hypothetical protein
MVHVNRWIRRRVTAFALAALCVPTATPAQPDTDQNRGCACVNRVGNVDCDYTDAVTMGDLTVLIDHLFISLHPLPNPQEANCDADPLCAITMGDLTVLIDHLFISLSPLPWCPQSDNHPPETTIDALPESVFVDGPNSYDNSLRVRLRWSGTDRLDNPYDPQVEVYRWKLFGPYDDSTYDQLISEFAVQVFQRPDGALYRYGQPVPEFFFVCDTSYVQGQQVIDCDNVMVDSITDSNQYGVIDTLLDVECASFLANPEFARIVDSSSDGSSPWVDATEDMFYNVYADHPCDTTTQRHFIFWVTAQDLDEPRVEDPTPDWRGFTVFEARHEWPVGVINWQNGALTNGPTRLTVKSYWCQAVTSWLAGRPDITPNFDSDRDFRTFASFQLDGNMEKLLRFCLRYRVIVFSSDDVLPTSYWGNQSDWVMNCVYPAMQSGTQAWVAMRAPLGEYQALSAGDTAEATEQYRRVWGVERVRFSAWYYTAHHDSTRIEDFIGAQPTDSMTWPPLVVDSALLHQRYAWPSMFVPWDSTLAALPEVDYCVPTPNAEVLYTYSSLYGDQHPRGPSSRSRAYPSWCAWTEEN